MKQCIKLFVLLVFTCTFVGCIDFKEKIDLNKDGSGAYEFTMDLSGMFGAMGGMKDMFGDSEGDGEEAKTPKPEKQPEYNDSTYFFKDMADSIKSKWKHPEVMNKVKGRIFVDEANQKGFNTFSFEFDDIVDIHKFWSDLDSKQLSAGGRGMGGMMGNDKQLFYFKKGKLSRLKDTPMETGAGEKEEDMEFLKMFLGEAQYTIEYNLPSKAKKVANDKVEYSNKKRTVTQSMKLVDIINGEADMSNTIKF